MKGGDEMFRGLRYFQKRNQRTEEELADAALYNMNLYLKYVEQNFPHEFHILEEHFEGLPGYTGNVEREGT